MKQGSAHYKKLLEEFLQKQENEVLEFKQAKDDFGFDKLGKYFSALANEASLANIQKAYLVFGVCDNKQVVGTAFGN